MYFGTEVDHTIELRRLGTCRLPSAFIGDLGRYSADPSKQFAQLANPSSLIGIARYASSIERYRAAVAKSDSQWSLQLWRGQEVRQFQTNGVDSVGLHPP